MKKEDLGIIWEKPKTYHYGKKYETICKGHLNGIQVAQNRFFRSEHDVDISYRISKVSGWVNYDKFVKLLLAEDKRREPARELLRSKGMKTLADYAQKK